MEHIDKLLIVCGPTATGKTALAVHLAKKYDGELVSADSRQVYKGMDIGTGKDYEELRGIPIWMYDVVNPDEDFSISQYRTLALKAIADIHSRRKLPIIVGGSGLYIKALIDQIDTLSVPPDYELRKKLKDATVSDLQSYISSNILDLMNNSDKNNPRRLIRKIEISKYDQTQIRKSVEFDTLSIGLTASLSEIQQKIEMRISKRIAQGALQEFDSLRKKYGNIPALQAPGYTSIETWQHDEIAYAKRQITWFKKIPDIHWFEVNDTKMIEKVEANVLSWYTSKDLR